MGPHSHIQRGAVFVQGPFTLKMVLDLRWCLPHQKGCFCIEIPQIQWRKCGVSLFSRAVLSCEVVCIWYFFLYNGTYSIQYTCPQELPQPICCEFLGCLPKTWFLAPSPLGLAEMCR